MCLCVSALQEASVFTSGFPQEPGRPALAQLNLPCLAAATVTQSSSSSHQTGSMRAVSQPALQERGIMSRAKLGPLSASLVFLVLPELPLPPLSPGP